MATERPGRIVVGVDGSDSSNKAIGWAADQAEKTGAVLELVTTWLWPQSYGAPLPVTSDFDPSEVAKSVNSEALEKVRSKHPKLDIKTLIAEGHPGPTLTEMAADADMLVVGSRGHSEIVGILIGSVSEYCVSHGTCPVVVLR